RRALPAGRVAASVALIRGRTDLAAVVLVAHPLPVAARRRARVAVAVRARRAVLGQQVRLHAHPELGIGAADLAARRRARVAVRVRARRARLRRAQPAGRVAALVALIRGRTDLAAVVLVAHPLPVAARRRARVAIAVRARCAVLRKQVRLHAHPDARAQLAPCRRARVAVRVPARRAHVRRLARPGGRVAPQVALSHRTARTDEYTARVGYPRRPPVVALRVRVTVAGDHGRTTTDDLDLDGRVIGIPPRGGLEVVQLHLKGDEAAVDGRAGGLLGRQHDRRVGREDDLVRRTARRGRPRSPLALHQGAPRGDGLGEVVGHDVALVGAGHAERGQVIAVELVAEAAEGDLGATRNRPGAEIELDGRGIADVEVGPGRRDRLRREWDGDVQGAVAIL